MSTKKAAQVSSSNASPSQAPAIAAALPPMELDVRINSILFAGATRATASVNVNGQLAIRGIKVMEGTNGLFVSMPSYKLASTGEYRSHCFPCTQEFHFILRDAVFEAYQQALNNSGKLAQSQALPNAEEI